MLRRVRDFAQVKADGVITDTVADQALKALEIDELGLDHRAAHHNDRLVGENDGAFGHCLDIPCKAELFEFIEEILAEYAQ